MSWPVGKCPNIERSDLFSLIGKQQKIAHLIAGHPVFSHYVPDTTGPYNDDEEHYHAIH